MRTVSILRAPVRLLPALVFCFCAPLWSQVCPPPQTPSEKEIIRINRLIDEARTRYNHDPVPRELVWAVIWNESQYDPSAENDEKTGVCSTALGLGQLHEETARGLGLRPEERTVPEKSVEAVTGYLSALLKTHKDDEGLVLAEYHLGNPKFNLGFGIVRPRTDKDKANAKMWKTDGDKYVTTVLRYRDFASKVVIPYIELASSSQANQRVIQENIGKIPKLEEEIHHFENDTSSASQTQVTQLKQQLQSTRAQLQSARDEQGVIERKESDLRLQLEQQQQVIQEQQQAIQKKDAQLQELTDELQRSATQIAQLESRPPSKEDAERIQQLQNRIAQLLANIQSLNGQLDAKDVYYRSQIAELKRGAESQLSDLRTLGERITVIHPPTVPADVRLCIPGSLVNPDKQLLDIGSEYLTWLETGDQPAMNLPIFSYIYPNFSYSSSPVVPMPGDYVGAAATHDTISLSIGPGGLLTHFQGSLKSQTHRGRLTIIPVVLQYQPCRFESGLVAAYLPNQDYYAFLILRASTPRDVVGYLFTRGDPKEQIVVIEFRAQWIGR